MDPKLLMMMALAGFVMRPTPVENTHFSRSEQSPLRVHEQVVVNQAQAPINDGVVSQWIDKCQTRINKSWAKSDSRFGYQGGMPVDVSRMMHRTGENAVVLMTAGVYGKDGTLSMDMDVMSDRFENAAQGMILALNDAARQGMKIH